MGREQLKKKTAEIICILSGNNDYPDIVKRYIKDYAPAAISAKGNLQILQQRKLAVFCSVKCPGSLILQTYDLMQVLRKAGVVVISGFHSPMERECLYILLRGTQPLIICPARSIEGMRLSAEYKKLLTEGRLLLISPFAEKHRRITTQNALIRNKFACAIADEIFIPYAAPGSKTEHFCREILAWGKPLLTLDSDYNAGLLALGAKSVKLDSLPERWKKNC